MNDTAERWLRIETLFSEALNWPPAQRAARLRESCAGDEDLLRRVQDLLAAADGGDDLLDRPVRFHSDETPPAALPPGTRLGVWVLGELLGRGGMGEVYAARRDDGVVEQQAALKLLKRGLDTDALLRRFLRERAILARLSHPNIARLLDAGAAPDGRPYLVMERVEGQPLDVWCRERQLDVEAVLRLMQTVCEAVHEAHRNLIVHRDLKPSNVLVTARGEVKLLDFGVAKLLDEDQADATRVAGEALPLTPAFAAPEQLLGQPVTTAADVYALGAMLYLLLSGRLPREDQGLISAVAAASQPTTARAPSQSLRDGGGPWDTAQRRLRLRALRGDLDRIVMKALRPEAVRRYASAQALAEDLRRCLAHEPVSAAPDSLGYLLRTFVRRHRLAALASAAVLVAVVAGIAGVLWQAHEAAQARDRAEARGRELAEVVAFQRHMLERVDLRRFAEDLHQRARGRLASRLPPQTRDTDLAAFDRLHTLSGPVDNTREALSSFLLAPAETEIGARIAEQPEVEAGLRTSLGQAWHDLGVWGAARPQLERALQLRETRDGDTSDQALAVGALLLNVLMETPDYAAARALAMRRVDATAARYGGDAPQAWLARRELAVVDIREGRYDAAHAALTAIVPKLEAAHGVDDARSAIARANLAATLVRLSRPAEAEPLLRALLATPPRTLTPELRLRVANNLSMALMAQSRNEEARAVLAPAVQSSIEDLGREHPFTLALTGTLASVHANLGDVRAAADSDRFVYETSLASLGPNHPDTLRAANNYATSLMSIDMARALRLRREVWQGRSAALGDRHAEAAYAAYTYAWTLREAGRAAEGAPVLDAAVGRLAAGLGARHEWTLEARWEQALNRDALGRRREALDLLRAVLADARAVNGDAHDVTAQIAADLQRLEAAARRP